MPKPCRVGWVVAGDWGRGLGPGAGYVPVPIRSARWRQASYAGLHPPGLGRPAWAAGVVSGGPGSYNMCYVKLYLVVYHWRTGPYIYMVVLNPVVGSEPRAGGPLHYIWDRAQNHGPGGPAPVLYLEVYRINPGL